MPSAVGENDVKKNLLPHAETAVGFKCRSVVKN